MPSPQAIIDGPSGTYSTPAQNGAVGGTTEEIVSAVPERLTLILVNVSSVDVFLGVGTAAVLNSGLMIAANGGVAQFGGPAGLPLTKEAINGITASGSGIIAVQDIVE